MNLKKVLLIVVVIVIAIMAFVGYNYYTKIYKPNTVKDGFVYIPTNASFEDVLSSVEPFIKNKESFIWVAEQKNYHNVIKPGKYKINEGISNNDLVNLLRSGKQIPVQLTFNNQNTLEELAGRIALQIEADSTTLINTFNNTDFLSENGFNNATAIAMYLPNTYEFYWNTSAEKFQQRMLTEYQRFWTNDKVKQAKQQNLSPVEVITLASIVQKETAHVPERPKVAGLYLNRLQDNWPLQADPTVIYALKKEKGSDFEVKRVLTKDLSIASPYNTYLNTGLPPGPIGMPDVSSINAVLNPAKHNYYYMCASVDMPGTHAFASTLQQHNSNAKKYQNWLNAQGVNR